MLLNSNHVLVNEICKQQGVAMSNFSPLSSDYMLSETNSVYKQGGTTVIDRTSILLPTYIRELALKTKHTDLTGLMMVSELKDEYYLDQKQIEKLGELVTVCDKKFVKLNPDFLQIFSNPKWIIYPVSKDEIEDAELSDIVKKKQFKQIDKNTFLTWY